MNFKSKLINGLLVTLGSAIIISYSSLISSQVAKSQDISLEVAILRETITHTQKTVEKNSSLLNDILSILIEKGDKHE